MDTTKPIRIRLRQVSDAPEDVAVEIRRALEGVVAGDWPDRIAAYYLAAVEAQSPRRITHKAALLELNDGARIIDATGREYVKHSSGNNANDIKCVWWVTNGNHAHTDWVNLPATIQEESA